MVVYYNVDKVYRNNEGYRIFVISNIFDTMEITEYRLTGLIKDKKVALFNYGLSSTGSGRLTKLKTNISLPQEKQFQSYVLSEILEYGAGGRYIATLHIDHIVRILGQNSDSVTKKFAQRLIDAVKLYVSYMFDVKVKVLHLVEDKTIHVEPKFGSSKIHLKNLCNINLNTDDLSQIKPILAGVKQFISKIEYTYIGEQMDKYFCLDIINAYSKSVLKNEKFVFKPLDNNERTLKANECATFFATGYNKFNEKLNNNKRNITNALKHVGPTTLNLFDVVDKFNSYSIDMLGDHDNESRNRKFLRDNKDATLHTIVTISEYFMEQSGNKLLKILALAANASSGAMLSCCENSSNGMVAACAGMGLSFAGSAINTFNNRNTETLKFMDSLCEYSINTVLPNDIGQLLNKLKSLSTSTYLLIVYLYERALFMDTVNDFMHNTRKIKGRVASGDLKYLYGCDKFRKKRDKVFKELSHIIDPSYYTSYTRAILDVVCLDDLHIRDSVFMAPILFDRRRAEPDDIVLNYEFAWLSACNILYDKFDLSKIYNKKMENQLFWKVFEDTLSVMGYRLSSKNTTIAQFMHVMNNKYNTCFIYSKDLNIDITKFLKDTREDIA